jgi:hypothetical protein
MTQIRLAPPDAMSWFCTVARSWRVYGVQRALRVIAPSLDAQPPGVGSYKQALWLRVSGVFQHADNLIDRPLSRRRTRQQILVCGPVAC